MEAFAIPSFNKVKTSKTGTASWPVLQLTVFDSPGPADTAVRGEGALQLDTRVGDLHVVVNWLAFFSNQTESRDWYLAAYPSGNVSHLCPVEIPDV